MKNEIIPINKIQNSIFTIRGMQVMLDSDLAEMYKVSTGRLNEQVKRNIDRFPDDFMFQLTKIEWENLKSQNAISSWGGRRKLPYVFTEQGISSLSGILKSNVAVSVNIAIMRAFVEMRKFISANASIFHRLEQVEQKQIETDHKVEQIFQAIEDKSLPPKQGVFFDGQIFDAYTLVADIVRSAKNSIVLIDNYVDDTVLKLLAKKEKTVNCTILSKNINSRLKQDAERFNQQYGNLKLRKFSQSHDRFLIIDIEAGTEHSRSEVYHIGASLKDLGKKWFAFTKLDKSSISQLLTLISKML